MDNGGNMIPDYEDFVKDVTSIWADGNMINTYKLMAYVIEQVKGEDGTVPTYSMIIEKWKTHIQIWNLTYGTRDERYIGSKERAQRKNLYDFLEERLFFNEYSLDKGDHKRDRYLFPQWLSIRELSDIFTKIHERIAEQQKRVEEGT